ncbi:MAG: hypothetical protein CFE45_10025 [Burkholderiales bacterium PBB5]|nr:MAG: hypothetical protein CFE45_10025 [Burkholderiales bacterium PBB5]
MNDLGTLRRQQQALAQAVRGNRPPPRRLLQATPQGRTARIDAYQHAYQARLAGALRDNFEVLALAMGDEAFAALAQAYTEAHPSRQPSIRWFGHRLADFMARHVELDDGLVPHPAMVDLARLDWALRDAFDAADAPVLDATALAAHRQHQPSGRLRVSMAADMAQHAFGDMLARFVAEYPALTLELDLSPRRVDLVGEGIDVAVRVGALADDASLAARRLGLFTTGLYAAPDYLARHGPVTAPAQLAGLHGLMTGPLDGEPRPWVLQHADGRRWQGQPATMTRANSPDLPMRLARAGVGVTGLPDFYLEAAGAASAPSLPGALQRVLPEWALPPVPVWAVFPGRRLLPTRVRLFIDALAATAATCRKVVPDAPA